MTANLNATLNPDLDLAELAGVGGAEVAQEIFDLRLLRGSPGFGAVILDLVMPDRDGMAVMEAMARDSITAPVIIQTAHSSLETVVSAMRQGAVDYLVKPLNPEELLQRIAALP